MCSSWVICSRVLWGWEGDVQCTLGCVTHLAGNITLGQLCPGPDNISSPLLSRPWAWTLVCLTRCWPALTTEPRAPPLLSARVVFTSLASWEGAGGAGRRSQISGQFVTINTDILCALLCPPSGPQLLWMIIKQCLLKHNILFFVLAETS